MKKTTVISVFILILFFAGCIIWGDKIAGQKSMDAKYLLPSGFKGCAKVIYNVKDAPPLTSKDNEIIYNVPKNGIIYTSSPSTFGWVNGKDTGHQVNAFYVDNNGKVIEKLPEEKIRFGANREIEEDGKPKVEMFFQIFGTKEDEDKGCDNTFN